MSRELDMSHIKCTQKICINTKEKQWSLFNNQISKRHKLKGLESCVLLLSNSPKFMSNFFLIALSISWQSNKNRSRESRVYWCFKFEIYPINVVQYEIIVMSMYPGITYLRNGHFKTLKHLTPLSLCQLKEQIEVHWFLYDRVLSDWDCLEYLVSRRFIDWRMETEQVTMGK